MPGSDRGPGEEQVRHEGDERLPVELGRASGGVSIAWEPTIKGNPHLMITGLPGMGKTTCLVNLIRQLQSGGIVPIIFSYHDDIDEKVTLAYRDAQFVDCTKLGFNPMRITAHQEHGHLENAGQLRDIFRAIFPDLGDLQREATRTALKESYEAKGWPKTARSKKQPGTPEFRDFVLRLRRNQRHDKGTQTLLARLGELDDYGFFTATSESASLLESQHPVVLQIHKTNNEAVQKAYAAFALYRIYQDMFARGRQARLTHAVIFDEAHKASKLKLIPTMAKECRKYGLAFVLASQDTKDFDSSLFTAIANYLILRVTDDTARHLARTILGSDLQKDYTDRMKGLPKFEALWMCEGRRQPVSVKLRSDQD